MVSAFLSTLFAGQGDDSTTNIKLSVTYKKANKQGDEIHRGHTETKKWRTCLSLLGNKEDTAEPVPA